MGRIRAVAAAAAAVIIEAPGRARRRRGGAHGQDIQTASVNGGLLFQLSEKPQSLSVGGENAYRVSLEC